MKRIFNIVLIFAVAAMTLASCDSNNRNQDYMQPKLAMQPDGIVRLSKIKIIPNISTSI